MPPQVVAYRVVEEGLKPTHCTSTSQFWKGLCEDCWGAQPEGRPTFDEIVRRLTAEATVARVKPQ